MSESCGPVDWASDSYPLSTESLVRVLSGSVEKMRWCAILYQPLEWLMKRHILLEYWSIIKQKPIVHCIWCGPGSSVGIATGYGLDGPWIESPTNLACEHLPYGQILVSGSNIPTSCWHPTADKHHPFVVLVEMKYILSPLVNLTAAQKTRGLGIATYGGKMSNAANV
jgi:hypothetical protein